ncbi:unnamed protein product [Linum trigynum]|uniref:DUF4283 domain-containing protein n=1 Tax=Linum trigynum TaxID=586398 RepID=A0AAV2E7R1_9ROSI
MSAIPSLASDAASSTASGVPVKPWADLFVISEANRLCYMKWEVYKGGVRVPKEVSEDGAAWWKFSLVGQFLHPFLALSELRRWANRMWGQDGPVRVSHLTLGINCFLFNFRLRPLATGFWRVAPGSTMIICCIFALGYLGLMLKIWVVKLCRSG